MKRRPFAVLAVVAAVFAVAAATAGAATVTVSPANMDGWATVHDTCGAPSTGSVDFVNGPATPPAGVGSVKFTLGTNGDSYETLRTATYDGAKLSDLTAFDYWTYVSHSGSGGQAAYIDLYIDNNHDGVKDDTLTFEPVYQTSQGTVALNVWQHWDALSGLWWAESTGGPPPLFTLSSYIASHPDARILNGGGRNVILATGCGGAAWTGFIGNADKLTIGVKGDNTTYDFEPATAATGKRQCKNGGWRRSTNPTFKNQGQCVAYANHHNGKGKDDQRAGKKKHGKP
ncbi:MAG: hypothetical protein E6G08_15590 [Actinobacteria bacterium]|nr:MAG: hypothetical protein E6G08_15590 [Actinomycetota bacterium]